MSTPYADSGVPINSTIYNQVTRWQGATPDGWGRYFLAPGDNGQSAGNGITWYSGATENSFFNSKQMRLLPIAGQGITVNDYNTGVSDATSNLNAVLKALSNKATNFPLVNGLYMCAFALDCETPNQGFPTFNFADYLAGWLQQMATGVTDSVGNQLIGWGGVYGGQDATKVWDSVNTCVSTYGVRPNFVAVSSYITPQLLGFPSSWDTSYTSTDVAIGQSTTLWQYTGDAVVTNSSTGQQYDVDLDMGNPNIDFHTALGQYCPIP